MRFIWMMGLLAFAGSANAQSMMRPHSEVLSPWDSPSSTSTASSMSSMRPVQRHRDPHLGSLTHFPSAVIARSEVLDPWVPNATVERERELMRAIRPSKRRIARCDRNGRGLVRYRLRLSPTRVSGGVDAECVERAVRRLRLSGRGTFELVLNFVDERPVGVYVIDRAQRRTRRASTSAAMTASPGPRRACSIPATPSPVVRTGDDQRFPDFKGMRIEAVRQHHHGPIAEAACRGLHTDVLDPWRRPDTRGPSQFERSWARRVRQRTTLVLDCIPPAERPPSWALTFRVETDGRVRALYDATETMATCIASRISAPPERYQLHVSFAETPARLYVDTR